MVVDEVIPRLYSSLAGHPGVEVVVSVGGDDGEVGEEDQDVGDDVADDEEGPGVDHVRVTGGQEVHRAGVQISLVHISEKSGWRLLLFKAN